MDRLEYDMYQDIPRYETGSENLIYWTEYSAFKGYLQKYIKRS